MKHTSHAHELYVSNMETNNQNLTCFGCKLTLFGTCYACTSCNFYLHKFCFELPQSAQHDFHAQHALGLTYPPYCQGLCDACGESCNGFTYNCRLCNFNIHASCGTLLQPDPKNYRDQYVALFLGNNILELKTMKSQVGSNKQQNAEAEEANMRKMEMEAELQRRRHNLTMQRLKQASDSIDFMGQIGTSSKYTYRYF